MSKKYINDDYTLKITEENAKDFANKSVVVEDKIIKTFTTWSFGAQTGSVTETGSPTQYSYSDIIFASRSVTTSGTNLISNGNTLFTHPTVGSGPPYDTVSGVNWGTDVSLWNYTMSVSQTYDCDSTTGMQDAMRGRLGSFVFESKSTGWNFTTALMIPESSYSNGNDASKDGDPNGACKGMQIQGNRIVMNNLGLRNVGDSGVGLSNKLHLYIKRGNNWEVEQILTTASLEASGHQPYNDTGYSGPLLYRFLSAGEGPFSVFKLYGNQLIALVGKKAGRPTAGTNSWSSSGLNKHGLTFAVFTSSSAAPGWKLTQYVSASVTHPTSVRARTYIDSDSAGLGVESLAAKHMHSIDFDGTTFIAAGYGNDSNNFLQYNGRIVVWKKDESGVFYEEDQIELMTHGLNTVTPLNKRNHYYGAAKASEDESDGSDQAKGRPGTTDYDGYKDWKLYQLFGSIGCNVSGSYIAAGALGTNVSTGYGIPKTRSRLFIFHSSSKPSPNHGWKLENSFESPNPLTGDPGVADGNSYEDWFGFNPTFDKSSPGNLLVRAPYYKLVPEETLPLEKASTVLTYTGQPQDGDYIQLRNSSSWTMKYTFKTVALPNTTIEYIAYNHIKIPIQADADATYALFKDAVHGDATADNELAMHYVHGGTYHGGINTIEVVHNTSANTLTFTQNVAGSTGNTTVSKSITNASFNPTNFQGGTSTSGGLGGQQLGRAFIYSSSSTGGWSLADVLDNPYSGSAVATPGHADNRLNNGYDGYGELRDGCSSSWMWGMYGRGGGSPYGGVMGFDSGQIAIGIPTITKSENDTGTIAEQMRWGAVQVLQATSSFKSKTVPGSTTTADFIPFRFSANNVQNIRLQSGSAAVKTFIGDQKS